jgi:hypothetical protein
MKGLTGMKRVLVSILAIAAGTMMARAGEVFGTLSEGARPIAAGVKVEIIAGEAVYKGETDKFGGYRLFVREKGKVTLKVTYKGQPASFEVASFDKATRYDLLLEPVNGKYTLRRK